MFGSAPRSFFVVVWVREPLLLGLRRVPERVVDDGAEPSVMERRAEHLGETRAAFGARAAREHAEERARRTLRRDTHEREQRIRTSRLVARSEARGFVTAERLSARNRARNRPIHVEIARVH